MLYILSKTAKTLNVSKFIIMNNKISFYILFSFLFIAFSCKSESKSLTNETKVKVVDTKTDDNPTETKSTDAQPKTEKTKARQVIAPVKKKEERKEIKKPKKKKEEKKPKRHTDPGIEIEMGADIEEKKVKRPETKVIEDKSETKIETEKPEKPERIEPVIGFPNHSSLDQLLKKYVSESGMVDYKGLKRNEAKLDEYLAMLESNGPQTTWNRDIELTYWINAYNAYTIKLILNNYPVKSITDIHDGKPWDQKWINLDGKSLSLNNIENDIIRPKFNEPRIHFAVNCAAVSCPPLKNGAYSAKNLDAQLESQTKKFINNAKYNTLGKNEIKVSKIFEWYGKDFGDIASFVLRYADKTVKPSAKVSYNEYDWSLNGK